MNSRSSALSRNLAALSRHDAALAEQIRGAPPLDADALEPSQAGPPTARLSDAKGRPVQLASRIDPAREAGRLVDAHLTDSPTVYVVVGLGLGYHVAELLARRGPEDAVVVAEANLTLLRSALERFDWSEPLAARSLRLVSEATQSALSRQLYSMSAAILLGTRLVVHPPSQRLQPDFEAAFRRAFVHFVAAERVNLATLATNTPITVLNLLMNLPAYVRGRPIDHLKGLLTGYPAIVVSAGPSLARNIHLLPEARDRAVIISVATTLKLLLDRGIEPHFVTCLDYHEASRQFFEGLPSVPQRTVKNGTPSPCQGEGGGEGRRVSGRRNAPLTLSLSPEGRGDGEQQSPRGEEGMGRPLSTHLVLDPKATWHVADVWPGTPSVLGNEFLDACLRDLEPPLVHDRLRSGTTVAHLAFYLARYLGCDPIILVGQDLGFSNGLYYVPGTAVHDTWRAELNRFWTLEMREWERIVRMRRMLRTIPDVHGRPMYTDDQMYTYLQRFEVDFQETAARVIDATEGGARKAGAEAMPLAAALARHASRPLPAEAMTRLRSGPPAQHDRQADVVEALRRRIADTEAIREICTRSADLLERLRGCLDRPKETRPIFAAIEDLRRQIDERPAAYGLVRAVAQADQLRRYQADRQIAAAGLDGPEKQRRQLERDLQYVTALAGDCEAFVSRVTRAIARLEAADMLHEDAESASSDADSPGLEAAGAPEDE